MQMKNNILMQSSTDGRESASASPCLHGQSPLGKQTRTSYSRNKRTPEVIQIADLSMYHGGTQSIQRDPLAFSPNC